MAGRVRIFSVSEANALVPRLCEVMSRMVSCVRTIEEAVQALRGRAGGAAPDLRDDPADSADVAEIKTALRGLIATFRQDWESVEASGGVIKDVNAGLVDFCGERGGDLVWLCWKLGESAVGHWHPIDRGFAAREPLESPELPRTLN